MPNVINPTWEHETPEPPFRRRAALVGAGAGATTLGATIYELEPGGAVSPYHVHHANEELAFVLAGTPTLRTPDGERTLETGEVVAFPIGPDGAHQLRNDKDATEPARILIVSTRNLPEIARYPDTGAVLAMTGEAEGQVFPGGSDVALQDAVMEAMRAHDAR